MAEVWESVDNTLDREVAVKLLHSHLADDPGFVSRFHREARAVARLSHPNIVAVFDTGIDAIPHGRPGAGLPRAYIVMELLRGQSVRVLSQQGVPITRAVDIVANAAKGLGYAHRQGLVHRDIKPANILVTDTGIVKVVDFGIAKVTEGADRAAEDLTQAGAILGTAKYLSPEQVEGNDVDARADVYALGVVLYELCCGRPPFIGKNDMATAMCHVKDTPPPPRSLRPSIPTALEAVIVQALSKDPNQRPANGDAFAAQLQQLDLRPDDAIPAIRRTENDRTPPAGTTRLGVSPDETRADASTRIARRAPDTTTARPSAGLTRQAKPASRGKRLVIRSLLAAITVGAGLTGGVLLAQQSEIKGVDLPIKRLLAFDPIADGGDGVENNDLLGRAIDGDPKTAWQSAGYNSRSLDDKSGVGVIVDLGAVRTIKSIVTSSTDSGWGAEIYIDSRLHETIEEWSSFKASKELRNMEPGTHPFNLVAPTAGRYVLIWITDLGPKITAQYKAAFSEIRVEG